MFKNEVILRPSAFLKGPRVQMAVLFGFLLSACGGGGGRGGAPTPTPTPTPTPQTSVALPKTGQTTCYPTAPVPVGTDPCADSGQDGEWQTGVAEPNPRFSVDGTGDCVTDNLTGLMWTRNANLPAGAGAPSTGARTWQQALDYANGLTLCGFTEWRLPNRKELRSLLNYSLVDNAVELNTQGFSNVQDPYWSSTSFAANPGDAWIMQMNGYMAPLGKGSSLYVWPVRAGR